MGSFRGFHHFIALYRPISVYAGLYGLFRGYYHFVGISGYMGVYSVICGYVRLFGII